MIVVSNTSPLTNLVAIGQFDLLHQLYGQVHIPEGVWREQNDLRQVAGFYLDDVLFGRTLLLAGEA